MIARRTFLALIVAASPASAEDTVRRIAHLERTHGGRLGVAIYTGDRVVAHRGDERFALCSTHKLLASAFVLARVDRGLESLDRRIVYSAADLVPYSPVAERHVGAGGMMVAELCNAALTLSDNTAANLLLDSFGGPAALTAYLRSIGDEVTRLDRREPALNDVPPGDPRDTTTPAAMLETTRKLVVGDALSPASRARLQGWLVADKTGDNRLRAGVPSGWRVGDKTGTGSGNATNDVAVMWPPDRPPILVAVYYTGAKAPMEVRERVLAEIGRLVAAG